jgi:hypothetical protein
VVEQFEHVLKEEVELSYFVVRLTSSLETLRRTVRVCGCALRDPHTC